MKTYEEVEQMFAAKGYTFFKGELNVNLFAIRKKINTNLFDDEIWLVYEENGAKYVKQWAATTDAGFTYLRKPMNPNGTAIIVPGQYRGAYGVGRHTSYEALRQQKPMKYYRDINKDLKHNLEGRIYEEIGYTNVHHAGKDSGTIDSWSAGCIVFKRIIDFNDMMKVMRKARDKYGNSFTFTLFSEV
jgi:hypothetical protein